MGPCGASLRASAEPVAGSRARQDGLLRVERPDGPRWWGRESRRPRGFLPAAAFACCCGGGVGDSEHRDDWKVESQGEDHVRCAVVHARERLWGNRGELAARRNWFQLADSKDHVRPRRASGMGAEGPEVRTVSAPRAHRSTAHRPRAARTLRATPTTNFPIGPHPSSLEVEARRALSRSRRECTTWRSSARSCDPRRTRGSIGEGAGASIEWKCRLCEATS